MNTSMISSANTLSQLQVKIDTHAHNLANLNTTGFKRRQALFTDLLNQQINAQPRVAPRQTPHGVRIGYGARVAQTTLRQEQGSPNPTNRPLDFMIEGANAWFRLLATTIGADGEEGTEVVYTRDGSFYKTPHPEWEGMVRLTAADGSPLLAAFDEEITFPAHYDTINLTENGILEIYASDNPDERVEYHLNLAYISRPDQLLAIGQNRYRLAGGEADLIDLTLQGEGNTDIRLHQGMLESSNVDLTEEMSQLIATQRLMQFTSRSITIADEMMGLANSIRS